jgi:hypothetical protein
MAARRMTLQIGIGPPSSANGKVLAETCAHEDVCSLSADRTSIIALSRRRQRYVWSDRAALWVPHHLDEVLPSTMWMPRLA